MYTCKLIAQEMRGLALSLHSIAFSTLYSRQLRTRAARWAYFVSRFRSHVGWYKVAQIVPAEVVQEVAGPQSFIHAIFCHYKNSSLPSFYRVAKAVTEPACRADVGTATEHENYEYDTRRWDVRGGLAAYLDVIKEPWRISTDELDRIGARLPIRKREASAALRDMWRDHPGRFRFSAAAAAIYFLNSLPTTTRKHIRRIHLDEDRVSVSHPECPIRGLLPFYLENPGLMIERRASLWNNLFQARAWGEASGKFLDPFSGFTVGLLNWGATDHDALPANHVTRQVALWMAEASHPGISDALNLVLDGGPTQDRSADVFREVVQRDAAWQVAKERRFNDPKRTLWMRMETAENCWHVVRFPQLLADINKPTSRTRCNFDPGQPWDDDQINQIISANQIAEDALSPSRYDMNMQLLPVDPLDAWGLGRDLDFDTASPLKSFYCLLEENMDPGHLAWEPPW
ncbi:hypothetical protein QC764_404890 [Podospora pseudoanserina]|uniref:Uncharacterized protein n=1 Tax=Podospora pseudoanserina TaxID=2609844 RepID=A0ABR0IAT0_9PEZI|nr:hypothetical protein QC764_404890 [Podospora pseudoanserina]